MSAPASALCPSSPSLCREGRGGSFSFYLAPATCTKYYKEATILDVWKCLTSPTYMRRQTEHLRSLSDPKERSAYKRSAFPYVTFSGTFGPNRRDDALQRHSSMICIDLDHLTDLTTARSQLLSDPQFETLLLFISPSGDGLKWVIPIDLSRASHDQWYQAVCNYLRATYGLSADTSCRNVARACFIPYDPGAYIAPHLLPEMQSLLADNPPVASLMSVLGASEIHIDPAAPDASPVPSSLPSPSHGSALQAAGEGLFSAPSSSLPWEGRGGSFITLQNSASHVTE